MEVKIVTPINLDTIINKIGYEIKMEIEKKEKSDRRKYKNEIEKTLGVLVSDGVYAYFVYVKSKKIDDIFLETLNQITEFIDGESKKLDQEYFQNLSKNLKKLLFFREVLEKVLIYARYHAKTMEDSGE